MRSMLPVCRLVGAMSLCMCSVAAVAGQKQGPITSIYIGTSDPGKAFIKVDGTYTSKPGCSAGVAWDLVFDLTTDTGKALYALALAAHSSGTVVLAYGTGDCPRPPYEGLAYLTTNP